MRASIKGCVFNKILTWCCFNTLLWFFMLNSLNNKNLNKTKGLIEFEGVFPPDKTTELSVNLL